MNEHLGDLPEELKRTLSNLEYAYRRVPGLIKAVEYRGVVQCNPGIL